MNQALLKLLEASNRQMGHTLVAPSFHTNSNKLDEQARESAGFFAARMLNHQYHDSLNPLEFPENGTTEKVHFRVGGRQEDGKPQPSSVFMIKPYYENLDNWQYGHYPISGWAEMAYHNMMHATSLGHLAMRVHAFPYRGSALLGVELEPGLHPVAATMPPELSEGQGPWNPQIGAGQVNFSSEAKTNAAQLGALDFLMNHQDRSFHNLLMKVDPDGACNDLLAIDNGLSGQYLESHRYAPYSNRDNLFNYLNSPAIRTVLNGDIDGACRSIASWWKAVKPAAIGEYAKQVSGIQHPELANHMLRSFNDRVSALDTFSDDVDLHGSGPYKDYIDGQVENKNKQIYHRAGVKVRKWQPQNDPHPFKGEVPEVSRATQCPTCGENLA